MTRADALKDFFRKTILPTAALLLLYGFFKTACIKDGQLDYLWLWILCGLPFGTWRLLVAAWYIPVTAYRLLTADRCTCIPEE